MYISERIYEVCPLLYCMDYFCLNSFCFCLIDGLAAFRTFLKTEFSDENIEFWLACEDYKKIKSPAKLVSKANKIYREFIDVQAPREVIWGIVNKMNTSNISHVSSIRKDV